MSNFEELSEMGWNAKCSVCMIPMEKPRLHYGGVSCYSCRSFFRRVTKSNQSEYICRRNNKCDITKFRRRNCIPCRYNRCVENGMRKDLVLSDDKKKQRFWKKFENYPEKPWRSNLAESGEDDISDNERPVLCFSPLSSYSAVRTSSSSPIAESERSSSPVSRDRSPIRFREAALVVPRSVISPPLNAVRRPTIASRVPILGSHPYSSFEAVKGRAAASVSPQALSTQVNATMRPASTESVLKGRSVQHVPLAISSSNAEATSQTNAEYVHKKFDRTKPASCKPVSPVPVAPTRTSVIMCPVFDIKTEV